MLSVGAIRFEDRFCKKGGIVGGGGGGGGGGRGFQHGMPCTWQLSWLAVEKPEERTSTGERTSPC